MLHFMLIDGTKSSILTLIIYITITTTIPLDIFSEVKNSNYNKNDLIYEITDKPLIELIVIGLQSGGNGLIQYQRIIIQHMIIQENSVVKNRKILYGSSQVLLGILLFAIVACQPVMLYFFQF